MKNKKTLLVVGLLVLLVALLVFVERQSSQRDTVDLWSMVPESTAMVYETASLPSNWESLYNSPMWNSLKTVEGFSHIESNMLLLDSLVGLQKYFGSKQVLIGTHVVSKNAFDFTFFFALDNANQHNKLIQLLNQFEEKPGFSSDIRVFNDYKINEITHKNSGHHFSYILHQNVFTGSFTPFLIEDVVRNIDDESDGLSFQRFKNAVSSFPKLANDEGNLYLNTAKLPLLLSVFTTNSVMSDLQPLANLNQTIFLDANLSDNQILLNGFSKLPIDSEEEPIEGPRSTEFWLSTFTEEAPQKISLYDYVPERTAVLIHMGFENGSVWLDKLYQYQKKAGDQLTQLVQGYRENLLNYHNVDLQELTRWIGNEIGILVLESIDVDQPDKVMLVHTNDTELARQQLKRLEGKLGQEEGSVGYREDFAGYQISEIRYKEFPATMVGTAALGFDQCFYLITDRYVIFANSIRTLKRLIADHQGENTWDKSLREARFLENSLDQANVSLFVNTARAWRLLLAQLTPSWRKFADTNESFLRSYDHLAVQFSQSKDDFYTSVALSHQLIDGEGSQTNQFRNTSRLFVDYAISSRPFVVSDHTNQTLEVVFQDEKNNLYLSELDGKIQWQDSLGASIIGDVFQIDFYNNGKLQYLFATDSAIHIIDRNGNYISGYPNYLPEGTLVKHFSLIDYDNSKNYRFLIADQEGKLWMYNKERENLAGWNPNAILNTSLATPAFHVRVRDKDFIVAVQQNGEIYALSRRGQPYAGFPIALDKAINSPSYVELGSSLRNTEITTVSSQGEIIAFNLEGGITKREQIYRPSPETRFQLCADALDKTFVIVRQDEKLFGLIDHRGRLIFEKNFISPAALAKGMLEIQYYNFGSDTEVYAVTDQVQEFTYLFDGQGTLIKDRPIESRFPIGLLYYEDEGRFQLFRNFENEFSVLSFTM